MKAWLFTLLLIAPIARADETLEFKVVQINSAGVLLRIEGSEFPRMGTLLTLEQDGQKKLAVRVVKVNAEKRSLSARTVKALGAPALRAGDSVSATVRSNALQSETSAQKSLERSKGSPSAQCNRKRKSIGGYGGFLDGIGALASGSAAYNIGCLARVHVGYGFTPLAFINVGFLHGGVRFFMPEWNLSPTIGLNFTQMTYGQFNFTTEELEVLSAATAGIVAIDPAKGSTTVLYMPIGLDWTSSWGFHLGAGTALAFSPFTLVGFYANLGIFF